MYKSYNIIKQKLNFSHANKKTDKIRLDYIYFQIYTKERVRRKCTIKD